MIEIINCPKCDAEPKYFGFSLRGPCPMHFVQCAKCGQQFMSETSREEAVTLWNAWAQKKLETAAAIKRVEDFVRIYKTRRGLDQTCIHGLDGEYELRPDDLSILVALATEKQQ